MKLIAALLLVLVAGCKSLSPDAGFSSVEQAVTERTGAEAKWVRSEDEANSVRARVKEQLAKPLSAQDAVQIALLNNPGLQAAYAEVGIAEADLVQASRWRGPIFSFARLRRGDEMEYERSVFFDVLGLITIPLSVRGEEARFAAAKSRTASEGLRVALETRKAWFDAVAARETARYREQVKDAAEASAELARRMAAVGNFPKLTLMREQAFYAETIAQLAAARQAEQSSRETLARLMGLWGEALEFQLPERLPELPKQPREFGPDLEAQALAQRLDVQAARRETEAVARSLNLTKVTRFVSVLEFGLLSNSETDEPRQRGWEIELGIPLFDFGTARTARAERLYMQSVNRAAEAAIQARSEVRTAYTAYRTNFDVARHYRDEIVPLRKRISEEMLLRYNAMLASVFELLADSREQVVAVNAYIETLRDFWIAESDFQMALTGRSPGAAGGAMRTAAPAAAAGGGGH
jgi:outer membrane protein TolC